MEAWTDGRVWDAYDAQRWIPPTAQKVSSDHYMLVVTPGTSTMNFVYGIRIDDGRRVDEVLDRLRAEVQTLGGSGVRIWVTPRSRPADLDERLKDRGYRLSEEAEVLVWELRDLGGEVRSPEFRTAGDVTVREVLDDADYARWRHLLSAIFSEPVPPAETLTALEADFHQRIREHGHSDRFLGFDGGEAVGVAGMSIEGPVANLFASGVLPSNRGRGVYGALVRARCESAAHRGAEIALVSARVGTSGPILVAHGFRSVGNVRLFECRW